MQNNNEFNKARGRWIPENDLWQTEEPFNPETIRFGVEGDERMHAFHQYIGWLIHKKSSFYNALEILVAWNENNKPPFSIKELVDEFDRCWELWSKKKEK